MPIVRDGMKYWIDEYFLGVDLLELKPRHEHYARVDILRAEIVHKLAHSLSDIDTSSSEGLQNLFMEETWATMRELEMEIKLGDEGRNAMLAELEEWAKSYGMDLEDSKIGWRSIKSAGYVVSRPGLWTRRGGFSLEGIDFVGAGLVLNIIEDFTRLTKRTTRRPLYEKIYAQREKPRMEALFNKRRNALIDFLSRISGFSKASIEEGIVNFSKLQRENIHHIYETFIENKVAIVDRGNLFKGLDVITSLKFLNLLSLYAQHKKAELIRIRKNRSNADYVKDFIEKLPESEVLATGIKQIEINTIEALSELARARKKIAITNSVNIDYKNATSEGIEVSGLTPEDLEIQASLMDSKAVTERLHNSLVKGFLSWVRNVSSQIAQIEIVAGNLSEYKDIIFLGAPALAEAIVHNQGVRIEGRRIHFVNNLEGTRFEAMEKLPGFNWDDTYVVVVSQGEGDSIQKENLKVLREKVKTKIAVVANMDNPLLEEVPKERRLLTTDIKKNEGVVSFSGTALALAMRLAGLDYEQFVSRVEKVIKDNMVNGVCLSGSAAGRFAGIIRGLGLKENHKGEPVKTIMMLSYDKASQYVINAVTSSSNQRLAGLRTYIGSLAPEVNHHDFQIAMGKNGTLMVLISPDKWPASQAIPPSAKPRWASTPENPYNTDDFMDVSKEGIQTELTEFSDHNIDITYKLDLEGLADLVGLIQVASEIDYAVSLECGEIKGKESDQALTIVNEFDKDFNGALMTKRRSRPSAKITMSDGMTTIDISGLMGGKGLLTHELPDALAAVAENMLIAQRSHHIDGQHIHLDEPHQATVKDEIKKALDLIRLASEDKENFIVVGVGGPHNDTKFGVQPLRGFYADEITGKKVLFGGYTLDPTLMKELMDAVDKDPEGTMIMYISSSGETAEPDNTYHILLEHLMKKSKDLDLNESAAKQRLAKEAKLIGKDETGFIAEMEDFAKRQGLTLAQYEFVRDRTLIITGKRGYLNAEASAKGFRRPAHPLSSGRHAIYTLTLYMMKALGMKTEAFIEGGQAYVNGMFLTSGLLSTSEKKKLRKMKEEIEKASADIQKEQIKLAVKVINKAIKREKALESLCGIISSGHHIGNMLDNEGQLNITSLEDFKKVVDILTREEKEIERAEILLKILKEEKTRNDEKNKAISLLELFSQKDPGFLAGALMGYIGRHKGRFRVKFVDLTQLLARAGEWRDKHLFNEGLNKSHISTIAESMETQDILNLLPALTYDKESIIVLSNNTNPKDPLNTQRTALLETLKSFLGKHGIPFVVLETTFDERAHATHILAMMQLNLGYGCTIAETPHGYSADLQVYGEEKTGKARVAVDVAGDKDRKKKPTGIDDVVEQFALRNEELIDIAETSMTIGQRFFDIIKGKEIIRFWGRPNTQGDELTKAASDGIMRAIEGGDISGDAVHSIITINPVTKIPEID
ncbi:MAG: hypothetical protein JSV93_04175 [Candidatus Omnitrophota bacterium]|nr:MAG: hypothetical protein JSV93_04175 [Candidatus Omnitrophota bacterium]